MKNFILYFLSAFLLLALQAVLFKGVKPDLILVLVCLYSLKYGNMKGAAFGSVAGLMVDSASGLIIGPNIISKLFAALLINFIRHKFFIWNAMIFTALVMGIALIDLTFIYLYIRIFSRITPVSLFSVSSVLQIIYTAAGSFVLYHIVRPDRAAHNEYPGMNLKIN
jgi:rod shape-determining protein MreD